MKFVELESCESTNDEAWKLFDGIEPVTVVTKFQTRGRGRQGRSWLSSDNSWNLLFSLALPAPKQLMSWSPLVAGICVAETVLNFSETYRDLNWNVRDLRLKWPNDVYVDLKKAGGILCESKFSGEIAKGVVIGVGLNLFEAPESEGIAIALTSSAPSRERQGLRNSFAKLLSDVLIRKFSVLNSNRAEELRQQWLFFAKLDRYSSIKTHDSRCDVIELKAVDLDLDGRLVCEELNSGKKIILDQPPLPG